MEVLKVYVFNIEDDQEHDAFKALILYYILKVLLLTKVTTLTLTLSQHVKSRVTLV